MTASILNRIGRVVLQNNWKNFKQIEKLSAKSYSNQQSKPKCLELLHERSLLKLSGEESSSFLQGLITNDMKHLEDGSPNMYSLFLNIKGRVLYDTILYKTGENGVFYIECDTRIINSLEKHLKMYRVRRKVDIESSENKMKVWAAFDPNQDFDVGDKNCILENNVNPLEGSIFPCGIANHRGSKFVNNIVITEDPRLSGLGLRILTESNVQKTEILKHLDPSLNLVDSEETLSYKEFRYKTGIGEGIEDLPPGRSLPLEINCDYLHGVSFHKGCYIGQELTARTYHTGVVRKRLMPLLFDEDLTTPLQYDDKILDESGKQIGRLKGSKNKFGLGLMRISEALSAKKIVIEGVSVKVLKPAWWPREIKKEAVST